MNQQRRRRPRALLVLLAASLSATACGHRMDRDALLAANTEVLSGGAAASGDDPGGTATGPSGTGTTGTTVATTAGSGPTGTADTAIPGTPAAGPGNPEAAAACSTPDEPGPIVIGSVGNYSGLGGASQTPTVRTVQVWVEYINALGGLCGRQVQLIVVDDRGDPAQHVAALRDLVENRHVVAFVNNAAALTAPSGRDYLESVQVPVIGMECTSAVEYESAIFFPQCADQAASLFGMIRTPVQFGGVSRLAVLYCAEHATCLEAHDELTQQGVAEEAGANVVYAARVSLVQPDFTSECRQARDAGAEFMFVLLEGTGLARLIESCHRQGYDPFYALGSLQFSYETKDQPGLVNATGALDVFPFVSGDTPARAEFQQVMANYYGQPPGPAQVYGWASAKLFQEAATRASRTAGSINPQALLDALHSFEGETLGGLTVPLTYPPGQPARNALCWFGVQAINGEWGALNDGQPICK